MRHTLLIRVLLLLSLNATFLWCDDAQARVAAHSKIAARMQELHVPAVSVAVLVDGKIAWTRAYGTANTETLFQAASISKPVAAMAALHMMQHGNFTLDEDVNAKLKAWKVPENEFTAAHKVTLRGLLSHSAGLTVHGFPGYAATAQVPTVVQILNGEKPANTAPIRVDIEPGSKWRYSGGGYTVMQQLLIDRTGMSFPQIMQRMVLGAIGMKRSTYEQPLPANLASNAATAHNRQGEPISGKWHTYPEMAAAGLWTTPHDLALWAIELRNAYLGRSNKVIERSTAQQMLTLQKGNYGLGVGLSGSGAASAFGHGGSNAGFRCTMLVLLESGNGAVVMTNGDNGGRLGVEVVRAIAAEYNWPAGWEQ
jgi:CubicO group peptidase (beta-lactamase class C family)